MMEFPALQVLSGKKVITEKRVIKENREFPVLLAPLVLRMDLKVRTEKRVLQAPKAHEEIVAIKGKREIPENADSKVQ